MGVFIALVLIIGKRAWKIFFRIEYYKSELERIFAEEDKSSMRVQFFMSPIGIFIVGVLHVVALAILTIITFALARTLL